MIFLLETCFQQRCEMRVASLQTFHHLACWTEWQVVEESFWTLWKAELIYNQAKASDGNLKFFKRFARCKLILQWRFKQTLWKRLSCNGLLPLICAEYIMKWLFSVRTKKKVLENHEREAKGFVHWCSLPARGSKTGFASFITWINLWLTQQEYEYDFYQWLSSRFSELKKNFFAFVTDCRCDPGGRNSTVCDKLSGQCDCKSVNITGRRCHRYEKPYYLYKMEIA